MRLKNGPPQGRSYLPRPVQLERPLTRQAALISDIAHVYDNSKLNRPPARILSFTAYAADLW